MIRSARRGGLLAILLTVALVQAVAYWPGIMTWDAVRQYGQALSGAFDDWHPPAMEWLWRRLLAIHSGPEPMLVLQLTLYWVGFALLTGWAMRRGRPGGAVALAACALLPVPLALMGAVLKDCLMAGALIAATGLMAWRHRAPRAIASSGHPCSRDGGSPGPTAGLGSRMRGRMDFMRDSALRTPAILLLLCAATLRFNAFLACLPLFVALLPLRWRDTTLRLLATSALSAALLIAAMPVANRLLRAEASGVELSLVIFDLGGITYHSGVDVFPTQPVADPVAVNAGCYSPVKWDPYSWWVEAPCRIGFDSVKLAFEANGQSPYLVLARAILAHPIAYAEHRLAHFNINARFLVHDEIERPVTDQSAPNDWHYRITPNPVQRLIDRAALISAHTPLGWPIWWMALALGVLILAPLLPSRDILLPLALSALLYGLGYLVFSVAAELRYHLWTMAGTAIAAVIAADDLAGGALAPRARLMLAVAPALLVAILCAGWRLLPA